MRTTIGTTIDAPPELVYRITRDVTRWERLLPHYLRSRVVGRHRDGALTCEFIALRAVVPLVGLAIPVTWRSRTWHEPATRRLRFVHTGGATRGMDVTWTIEPAEGDLARTRVEIAHDFRPRPPLFARFVDRLFTRSIAGATLAAFKALAEAVADEVATSDPSWPTKDLT